MIERVAPRTARGGTGGSDGIEARWWSLALPGGTPLPAQSGVLVASGEPLHAKAMTLTSRKWGARGNVELVRLSFGRFGDELARSVGDEELVSWASDDLAPCLASTWMPSTVTCTRWLDAMPQYGPGHARRRR